MPLGFYVAGGGKGNLKEKMTLGNALASQYFEGTCLTPSL